MSVFSDVCFLHVYRQPYVTGSCCPGFDSSCNLRSCLRGDLKVIQQSIPPHLDLLNNFPLQETFSVCIQVS